MKKLFLYLTMVLLFASCIQKEALNAEADIELCTVLDAVGKPDVNIRGNVIITNDRVTAWATPQINLSELTLNVKLTEGATISPNPKELYDYSTPKEFIVTSQDGLWSKSYKVNIDTSEMLTRYDFENSELNGRGKYEIVYEVLRKEGVVFNQYIWASGNAGFALTGVAKRPEEYPTTVVNSNFKKKGAKLETKSTGGFGEAVHMPIAAGNLFIGSFDVSHAMTEALESTLFGLPFRKKPLSFSGHYKFRRGKVFQVVGDNGKPVVVEGRKDVCDIYAVLYESEGLVKNSLNGGNVLSSPNIVALARLKNPEILDPDADIEGASYKDFNIVFDYASYNGNRPFDANKMKNYEYNLAVVFTSSVDGARFAGAVGSVLYVDDVEVVCE